MKKTLLIGAIFLLLFTAAGISVYANMDHSSKSQQQVKSTENDGVIRVYGPGGPLGPMKEAAEKFTAETGMKVIVTAGPESNWIGQAKQDADIIYGGSEYMLRSFMLSHPQMINEKSLTELYPRAAGILVRKGNPKNIGSLKDLTKSGVKIIDVNGAGQLGLWEDLAGRKGLIGGISQNIDISVKSSAEAIEIWKSNEKHDAWITYESWHYRLKDVTELVELPEAEKLYRGTPIALTAITENKNEAQKFVDYLKTESSHKVFQKWGWK
ncbi:extracellular solute-binding protein [Fictibacillus barbaricus]|uniref:Extracellular solute-binding protein n=2 Tax=Fictibacillus barbaricus TaxID=182136 RepID=A0ABS2ZCI3_9BACL|nr:extracellular solute-binding protein [Fictibacillus barbaricus]MBN3544982.1 extracellular solute-binding protein [Fictibacillus barbaricus]GGB62614.1 ABC transporter substrate-binding protein [Fictibacillus barbaricus]